MSARAFAVTCRKARCSGAEGGCGAFSVSLLHNRRDALVMDWDMASEGRKISVQSFASSSFLLLLLLLLLRTTVVSPTV